MISTPSRFTAELLCHKWSFRNLCSRKAVYAGRHIFVRIGNLTDFKWKVARKPQIFPVFEASLLLYFFTLSARNFSYFFKELFSSRQLNALPGSNHAKDRRKIPRPSYLIPKTTSRRKSEWWCIKERQMIHFVSCSLCFALTPTVDIWLPFPARLLHQQSLHWRAHKFALSSTFLHFN